eukprot:CAMPEP_0203667768 /NCGR_PEP_ID=MMETSP0090-20130426/4542_1 /ASSEMBLY_ACC=CAM_ASM_001088 /TAXON_ID=426623 /ORGANISM="Chaetoceros affinis, Strain CCMP159" /LENGTH=790 /DNA_ID=CAMNT_0050532033 /DNA_START=111 /DNA_END=2483 /DNA_ORIENTATION=+
MKESKSRSKMKKMFRLRNNNKLKLDYSKEDSTSGKDKDNENDNDESMIENAILENINRHQHGIPSSIDNDNVNGVGGNVTNDGTNPKKVFIIGAGPSGLVALKEMLEAGHDVVCVDAKKTIGGLFSVSYNELYTTTTSMFLAFSDFPPKEGLRYWSKDEYLNYLEEYVDHFGLRRYIKLNVAVEHCALDQNTGQWKILTKSWQSTPGEMRRGSINFSIREPIKQPSNDNKRASYVFRQNAVPGFCYDADYLIVASGTNQVPRIPELHNCTAEVIHSADFQQADFLCEDKNVLVIGNGESASDVAAQSTDVAKKVTLYSRRDFSLGPRFISKFLTDGAYDERQILLEQDKTDLNPNDMLEGITNSRVLSRLPVALFSIVLDAMLSDVTKWHGENSAAGILAKIDKKNFRKDFYALDTSAPTKSGGVLAHAVACKGLDIIVSPEVKFEGDGKVAHFENVSFMGKDEKNVDTVDVDVDLVILCTGYKLNFDWIEVEGMDGGIEANPRKWFKHCFPPKLGDKVAFLGYARPAQGGIPQCSELLARYVALLLKEERTLPEDYADQALKEGQAELETFYATPNATSLVEFPPFASSVARLIGCEPSIFDVVSSTPSRFVKFWTLPQWMCFYRLRGPGANPKSCWEAVDTYSIFKTMIPMPVLLVFFLYGALMQPLMIIEKLTSVFIDCGLPSSAVLPRYYKWRVGGHFFQLSGNAMRFIDLVGPSHGFLILELILMYTNLVTIVAVVVGVITISFVYALAREKMTEGGNDANQTQESQKLLPDYDTSTSEDYGSVV